MERGREFADIIYTLLVVEKVKRIEDVADALRMSYASLHARLINRTCFSADEIKALAGAIPDLRLVDYFLDGSGYVAVRRQVPATNERPQALTADMIDVQHGATRVVVDATDILEIVDAGLAGGRIDHRIARLALRAIGATGRALASLRMTIAVFK